MTEAMTELALFEALALDCRVDVYGTVCYYNALGQRHRAHGPAIARLDGYRAWFQDGQRHRLDGPAAEHPNGYRAWWQNGQLHRVDGPAIEWPDGTHNWYIDGNELAEAEWRQAVASMEAV